MRHNLAMITARGGSKRIPRKNIKENSPGSRFLPTPLRPHALPEPLMKSWYLPNCSHPEIAGIAVKYGASVPLFRSEATAR